MRARTIIVGSTILLIMLLSVAVVYLLKPTLPSLTPEMSLAPTQSIDGFLRADSPWNWKFPDDHGSHPEFQTEWWYFTGNLEGTSSQKFGYQLTFFRRALVPQQLATPRTSAWGTDQIYLMHFAISDITHENYHAFEKYSRGAAGLAGAIGNPLEVWVENNSIQEITPGSFQLNAEQNGMKIHLSLKDTKGPILHGVQGLSQKGSDPGQASYYYSLPRLSTSGSIAIDDEVYEVRGLSWMDHEFSTSALSQNQTGWDWFSLQLDDQSELMVFQIRRDDGSVDPFSSGTYILPDGTTESLSQDDFTIEVLDTWKSSNSDSVYPSRWKITIPSLGLVLEVKPYLADQEINLSYTYWEGAVQTNGTIKQRPIEGSGYVELTGYAQSLGGKF